MDLVIIGLVSVVLIGAGALVALYSWRSINTDNLSTRLNEYVAEEAGGITPVRSFEAGSSAEISGSLLQRVLMPLVKNIGQFFGRMTPASQLENLRHQLTIAGNPAGLGAREFYGLRMVSMLMGILIALVLLRCAAADDGVFGGGRCYRAGLLPAADCLAAEQGEKAPGCDPQGAARCPGYVECVRYSRAGF